MGQKEDRDAEQAEEVNGRLETRSTREGARELGGDIQAWLAARTMALTAQGKPLHEDHPEIASEPPSLPRALEQIEKAEVMLSFMIEKLDSFARSFGLPAKWWSPTAPEQETPPPGTGNRVKK